MEQVNAERARVVTQNRELKKQLAEAEDLIDDLQVAMEQSKLIIQNKDAKIETAHINIATLTHIKQQNIALLEDLRLRRDEKSVLNDKIVEVIDKNESICG